MRTFDTIVIGAGQAGLATGYYLTQHERDFVILDAGDRVGDSWRTRWDSLKLFTPAASNALPGMPFPAPDRHLPHKDEMAAYLEAYADRFDLPVRLETRVTSLMRAGDTYHVETDAGERLRAENVVVATGAFQAPNVPAFAEALDDAIPASIATPTSFRTVPLSSWGRPTPGHRSPWSLPRRATSGSRAVTSVGYRTYFPDIASSGGCGRCLCVSPSIRGRAA